MCACAMVHEGPVCACAMVHEGPVCACAMVHEGPVCGCAMVHEGPVCACAMVHEGPVCGCAMVHEGPVCGWLYPEDTHQWPAVIASILLNRNLSTICFPQVISYFISTLLKKINFTKIMCTYYVHVMRKFIGSTSCCGSK